MSDDLIERLRREPRIEPFSNQGEPDYRPSIEHRAADEIERLRAEAEGAAAIIIAERSEVARLRAENARFKEALTASADTKAAYMGEVECESSGHVGHHVPWTSIKQIMRMIRTRAALQNKGGE